MDPQTDALVFDFDRYPTMTPDQPGVGGVLRQEIPDFQVEEVPAAPPDGDGEHLLVLIEKRDMTTRQLVEHLQETLELPEAAIGWAGLKDRRAITRQWLSLPADREARLAELGLPEGARVLETARHGRKLQEGYMAGNRFRILIREAAGGEARARAIMETLAERGVPNLYGPQRFGRDGLNAEKGHRILKRGQKPKRWLDKLLVNSLQSLVFNAWVAERMARGLFSTVIHGDIAVKHETGGKFLVGDPEAESPRAERFEISASGPLFGKKYHEAQFEARAIEDEVLERFSLTRADFNILPGTRRAIRFPLTEWAVEETPEGLWVSFFLPSGAYATAVLREVMKQTPVDAEA